MPCDINDVGLTLEGIQQISNLSRILAAIGTRPKNIWCSPLRRTRATLEHLNVFCPDFAKATVAFDDRLIERQRGYEAAAFADLQLYLALNPRELAQKKRCPPLHYAPPGGESLRDVRVQAGLLLQEILVESRYGDNLVVTHHSVISLLRSQLEKWPESDFLTKLIGDKPPNCGVVVYNSVGDAVSLVSCSW
ncbi:MAG: histidine phosphatase family protein [Patescibacteria group bacterium]